MTTGALLYLVSACASAEQFVAAFRRYADRAGLFVPIADPLPQGRRGRVALTLSDGRIVLESEVEIASSSQRPSPLYGRVGMTLRFVDPDDATRTTLAELEKARLAMKPAPLTAQPRAAEIPAEPRPTPPPVGGRIDAANALAESVAVGEVATWTGGGTPKTTVDSPSAKFVIPTIPQVGARPKTPTVPPALQPKSAPEPKPPPLPGTTPVVIPPKVVADQKATTLGMPALDRTPGEEFKPSTTMGMPAIRMPAEVFVKREPTPIPRRDPTPVPKRENTIQIPKRDPNIPRSPTTLGMPVVRPPAAGPATIESPAPPPPQPTQPLRRAHTPSAPPPMPRNPTPYTPLPIVKMPASLDLGEIEATERTTVPEPPPVGEEQKKTSLGVSMMSASPVETGWDESGPAYVGPPPIAEEPKDVPAPATASRSGGLRASEIMAAMKGDDWTMTPDASAPTVVPKPEPDAASEKSGPAGDWAISLDPEQPGGWSAPSKVEKLPEIKQAPASGNRNIAIASDKAIEAVEWEEKPTGIGEALVQIDPSLLGQNAHQTTDDVPIIEDEEPVNIVSSPVVDVPPPTPKPPPTPVSKTPTPPPWAGPPVIAAPAIPPPLAPTPAPVRPDITDNNTNFFRETGDVPAYPQADPTDQFENKKKRRTLYIVIAAAVVAAAAAVVFFMTSGGGKKPEPKAGSGSALAIVAPPPVDAAAVAPPPPAPDAAVAAPTTCAVAVTTVPSGAEISVDTTVVGTSPVTIQLPCGVESKLTIRKAKFGSVQRSFTATAEANKLAVKITSPLFSLKVTSLPEGANITIGGKMMGITPTTIKISAVAPTTITLTKPGYAPDTQKVAPRANNATHHVTLKQTAKQKLR